MNKFELSERSLYGKLHECLESRDNDRINRASIGTSKLTKFTPNQTPFSAVNSHKFLDNNIKIVASDRDVVSAVIFRVLQCQTESVFDVLRTEGRERIERSCYQS